MILLPHSFPDPGQSKLHFSHQWVPVFGWCGFFFILLHRNHFKHIIRFFVTLTWYFIQQLTNCRLSYRFDFGSQLTSFHKLILFIVECSRKLSIHLHLKCKYKTAKQGRRRRANKMTRHFFLLHLLELRCMCVTATVLRSAWTSAEYRSSPRMECFLIVYGLCYASTYIHCTAHGLHCTH